MATGSVIAAYIAAGSAAVGAGVAVKGAIDAKKARKEQAAANEKSEAAALAATKEQEALALAEKKKADTKLEQQRARILKGQTGRGGLLFGEETGVTDTTRKQTLGA
jgi:ribosomal protein L9